MIYDCFIFFNELELLELRLSILADRVDRFVLVEADTTFSGQPKPLHFLENRDRFSDFLPHIEHVIVRDMPDHRSPWVREIHQRNAMMRGLGEARGTDLILMSDLDEIPNVASIEPVISNDDIHVLEQRFYYYYFNLRKGMWRNASAKLMQAMKVSPQEARSMPYRPIIEEGGWHFSYLMAPDNIASKIAAFSHQEFNTDALTAPEQIKARIDAHDDLFGRDAPPLRPEQLGPGFPDYLRANQDRYKDYILSV